MTEAIEGSCDVRTLRQSLEKTDGMRGFQELARIGAMVDAVVNKTETRETRPPIVPIIFLKLGGTWDMFVRDGRRVGSGNLDDDELRRMQESVGLFGARTRASRNEASRTLANTIYRKFLSTPPEPMAVADHLKSWCHDLHSEKTLGDYMNGPFIPLFSGDSSHLKSYLTVPMILYILQLMLAHPTTPIKAAQGTDTADIAVASGVDVMLYDTRLPTFDLTGANHPHGDKGSDAPGNFMDSARLSHVELESGAYWNFHGHLYQAADFVKIDPIEARQIEEQGTFFSPHRSALKIDDLVRHGRRAEWNIRQAPPKEHIIHRVTMESLYRAFEGIYVTDLGNQNPGWNDMERIFDTDTRGVVVAGHSLGNVDNEMRADIVEAAKIGKLVVSVSRTLIGSTSSDYEASLATANENPRELGGTGLRVIVGHKLNRTIARALLARAILEGRDQQHTQKLFDSYAKARNLL